MGEPARSLGVTIEDFCAFEGQPGTRYELFGGEIVAMNQPTVRHAALQMSLGRELLRALEGRCDVLGPIGVYCEATGEAFGPDVVVICEPAAYDRVLGRALTNPSAIFEILSPSTSRIDTHDKLPSYKAISSLREYVLVSQAKKLIQVHRRETGSWMMDQLSSGNLSVCGAEISIDAIYDRVETSPLLGR